MLVYTAANSARLRLPSCQCSRSLPAATLSFIFRLPFMSHLGLFSSHPAAPPVGTWLLSCRSDHFLFRLHDRPRPFAFPFIVILFLYFLCCISFLPAHKVPCCTCGTSFGLHTDATSRRPSSPCGNPSSILGLDAMKQVSNRRGTAYSACWQGFSVPCNVPPESRPLSRK